MLRKEMLALVAIATAGLVSPTMASARDGGDAPRITRTGNVWNDGGSARGFRPGDFGGDPRFRVGFGYGLRPYDYQYYDYNFYDYPNAHGHPYVDRR